MVNNDSINWVYPALAIANHPIGHLTHPFTQVNGFYTSDIVKLHEKTPAIKIKKVPPKSGVYPFQGSFVWKLIKKFMIRAFGKKKSWEKREFFKLTCPFSLFRRSRSGNVFHSPILPRKHICRQHPQILVFSHLPFNFGLSK